MNVQACPTFVKNDSGDFSPPPLLQESLVGISSGEAGQCFPFHKPCVATVYRYARHGLYGIKLESALVAGRRFTSREAISRFVAATQPAGPGKSA